MENTTPHYRHHERKANHFLAHSYSLYFLLLLVGIFLDLITHIWVFQSPLVQPIGFTLIGLATILIIWAESTHHHRLDPSVVSSKEHLRCGPYAVTRHPTHWGLFFLLLGLGVLLNAFFVVITITISFIISKLTFLRQHDVCLTEKYGDPYEEYKRTVKF